MKRWFLFFTGIILLLGACTGEEAGEIISTSTDLSVVGKQQGRCGDGLCDGPENVTNCPLDCKELEALPTISVSPTTALDSRDVPPLYFFYAIHAHGSDEKLPFDDPGWQNLNPQVAENMIVAIEDIAEVLDRYGVKGTWEVLPATAQGLCSYQGEDHIFHQLILTGHEVGTHAHRIDDIGNSYQALSEYCGIQAETTSGFIAQISPFNTDEVQEAMSLSLQVSADLGIMNGTTNLSPGGGRNPFAELCNNQIGLENAMWSQSGNLMFPWKPDMLNKDVCAHSDEGPMLLIDHVSIEWIKLPGQQGVPDVLTDQNFNQLKNWFDGALQYMQEERPQRVAVWGFVTHITEYAVGSKAENPLDPGALAALDRFLAYVDEKRIEGKIVYVTASEIADLIVINQ